MEVYFIHAGKTLNYINPSIYSFNRCDIECLLCTNHCVFESIFFGLTCHTYQIIIIHTVIVITGLQTPQWCWRSTPYSVQQGRGTATWLSTGTITEILMKHKLYGTIEKRKDTCAKHLYCAMIDKWCTNHPRLLV